MVSKAVYPKLKSVCTFHSGQVPSLKYERGDHILLSQHLFDLPLQVVKWGHIRCISTASQAKIAFISMYGRQSNSNNLA